MSSSCGRTNWFEEQLKGVAEAVGCVPGSRSVYMLVHLERGVEDYVHIETLQELRSKEVPSHNAAIL